MAYARVVAVLIAVGAFSAALGGTASATEFTSPEDTVYTGSIVAKSEGHVILDNPIANAECESSLEAEVESHGEGVTAKAGLESLSFTGCTNSWHVTVVSAGSLEFHATESGDGSVISSGATIEATRLGVTCRYATESTAFGTLTGSYTTETTATLDVEAKVPFHSGSFLCGESTTWTGSYTISSPEFLTVDANAAQTVRLCKKAAEPCPKGETHLTGTKFTAGSTSASIASFNFEYNGVAKSVNCTEVVLAGETNVTEAVGAVTGNVGNMQFINCKPAPACEVTVPTKPKEFHIRRNKGYTGLMQLKGNTFKFKIACAGEFECFYQGNQTSGVLKTPTPPIYNVKTDAFIREPGTDAKCDEWLTLQAEWRFEVPQVVYVSRG
jgi:hypothetical protein